jgi:protein-disulfide isomerase
MKFTTETKIFAAAIGITVLVIGLAVLVISKPASPLLREDLIPATAHVQGNRDAQVYLVEFSDFQCPACTAVKPLVDEIIKTNGEKVEFAYRHYPLPQHPLAQIAAEAAEAAGAQGKFWEMFDLIFASSETFTEPMLIDFAKQLKLDMNAFTGALTNGTYKSIVQSDVDAGNRIGIDATPTFFLNGKKLELTNFSDLKTSVEQAIGK